MVQILRNYYDCQMQIELWHDGSGEISAEDAKTISKLRHVTYKTITDYVLPSFKINEITASHSVMAIIYSNFEKVLFLRPDTIPLQTPEFLFDLKQFAEHKTVFWPSAWYLMDNKEK